MNKPIFRSLIEKPGDTTNQETPTGHFSAKLLELLKKLKERDLAQFQGLVFDAEFTKIDEKVSHLLAQYKKYTTIYEKIAILPQNPSESFEEIKSSLESELAHIGDEMKFDNPIIWIKYKLLAYKNDKQKKIETIGNLISHCSSSGDICTKRLHFFNANLQKYFSLDFYTLNPQMRLEDFLLDHRIKELSLMEDFMLEWLYYEYYKIGKKVSKWSNYTTKEKVGNWNNYR